MRNLIFALLMGMGFLLAPSGFASPVHHEKKAVNFVKKDSMKIVVVGLNEKESHPDLIAMHSDSCSTGFVQHSDLNLSELVSRQASSLEKFVVDLKASVDPPITIKRKLLSYQNLTHTNFRLCYSSLKMNKSDVLKHQRC